MKTRTLWTVALLGMMCSLAPVQAQGQRVDGYRVHYANTHEGFYFSFSPGLGGGGFRETNYSGPDALEMSGGTSNLDVKIGGTVSRNLVLSGDIIGVSMLWPDTKIGDVNYGRADAELRQGLLGVGLTYYLMPANVLLSGTLGVGGFSYATRNSDYESYNGLGFQLKIGKEWWVSPRWGVGISAFFLDQHVRESANQDLNGGFVGLLLNTSVN